jgi:hypothetical protein
VSEQPVIDRASFDLPAVQDCGSDNCFEMPQNNGRSYVGMTSLFRRLDGSAGKDPEN